jgi:hypothetical protein
MKLTGFKGRNFIGCRDIDITVTAPVLVVAGDNEAGKSSMYEAIKVAFTGEMERLKFQKDYAELVTDGARTGQIHVESSIGSVSFEIPTGKWGSDIPKSTNIALLKHVLGAGRLTAMNVTDMRRFLFALRGASLSDAEVTRRLKAREGVREDLIDEVIEVFPKGFDAAMKYAADQAKQGKGRWCEVTGERGWGSEKGPKWEAAEVAYDPDVLATTEAKLVSARAELAAARTEHGRIKGIVETAQKRADDLAAVRATIENLPKLKNELSRAEDDLEFVREDLNTATRDLNAITAEIAGLQAAAQEAAKPVATAAKPQRANEPPPMLAEAADVLRQLVELTGESAGVVGLDANDATAVTEWDSIPLTEHAIEVYMAFKRAYPDFGQPEPEPDIFEAPPPPPPVPAAKLAAKRDAAARVTSTDARVKEAETLLKGLRDRVSTAEGSTATLAALEGDGTGAQVTQQELDAAAAKVDDLVADEKELSTAVDQMTELKRKAAEARRKTKLALSHHQTIIGWLAIAEAMSPDGIQAEVVAETLEPLNATLRDIATQSGWPQVTIEADMTIRYGTRRYGLLAKSGQWRCDACLTVMVAVESGLRFVMLDGFDINSIQNRMKLMRWMHTAVRSGMLEGAALFGTMKAPPDLPPATFTTAWLEGGRNVEFAAQKAA